MRLGIRDLRGIREGDNGLFRGYSGVGGKRGEEGLGFEGRGLKVY